MKTKSIPISGLQSTRPTATIPSKVGFLTACAVLYSGMGMSSEWTGDNHEILVGSPNSGPAQEIYLRGLDSAPEDIPLFYGHTVSQSRPSTIEETVLFQISDSYSLDYGDQRNLVDSTNWSASSLVGHYGDFNGDRLQDLLIQPRSSSENGVVVLGFPAGSQPQIWQTVSSADLGVDIGADDAQIVIQDVNGDGRDDVVIDSGSSSPQYVAIAGRNELASASVYEQCSDDCGSGSNEVPPFVAYSNSGVTLNESAATVGSLPGRFSVTAQGNASYSIPLAVPLHVGQNLVQLDINYDQLSGNSTLGRGWYLAGASKIARCQNTLAQDGYINAVNFDASDQFCLDGQRLVLQTDGTYRTEIDSFIRVSTVGSSSNIGEFLVEYPNGIKKRYLPAEFSKDYSGKVYSYALAEVVDGKGNYATYEYHSNTAAGEFWLEGITLNQNKSSSLTASKIELTYEPRTDVTTSHRDGVVSKKPLRVKQIAMKVGSTTARRYTLQYISGQSGRSLLSSVQHCLGASGACQNATQFDWDEGAAYAGQLSRVTTKSTNSYDAAAYSNQQYLQGDVNGDGRSDVVWVYRNANKVGRVLFLANGNGSNSFTIASSAEELGYNASIADEQQYSLADVNGDGKADLIWIARHIDTVYRTIYLASSSGTGFESQGYQIDSDADYTELEQSRYIAADVNGDARTDLIWIGIYQDTLTMSVYQARTNASGRIYLAKVSEKKYSNFTPSAYSDNQFETGDVNGDGKIDLVWGFTIQDYLYRAVYIASSSGVGFDLLSFEREQVGSAYSKHQFSLGDVNGDGRSDLVWTYGYSDKYYTSTYLATTKGTSFEQKSNTRRALSANSVNKVQAQLSDLDGDGRSDLIYSYLFKGEYKWRTYLADMDGEGFSDVFQKGTAADVVGAKNNAHLFADTSGDGNLEMVWGYNVSNEVNLKVFNQPGKYPDHLTGITNGLGHDTSLEYEYLTNTDVHLPATSQDDYPIRNNFPLGYVVAKVASSDGVGGSINTEYTYVGAKRDQHGRGFLGFESRDEHNVTHDRKITTRYRQDFPYIGRTSEQSSFVGSSKVAESNVVWNSLVPTGTNTVHPYQDIVSVAKLSPAGAAISAISSDYSVNSQTGNVEQIVEKTGKSLSSNNVDVQSVGRTLTQSFEYDADVSNWRLRFLSEHNYLYQTPGQPSIAVRHEYTPHNATSMLTRQETKYSGSDVQSRYTYSYDSFGNVIKIDVNASDPLGSSVSYSETTSSFENGLFPTYAVNAEGHKQTESYHSLYGYRQKVTDPNGLNTNVYQDGFGNLIRQIAPDGTSTNYAYARCSSGCPSDAVYYIETTVTHPRTTDAGAPATRTYFDLFGREVAIRTQNSNGQYIWTTSEYDSLGLLRKKSLPYIQGETKYFASYEYDELDRIEAEDRPDGGKLRIVYTGNSAGGYSKNSTETVVSSSGSRTISSTTRYNPLGEIYESFDGENVKTAFTHNSMGLLSTVVVDSNQATKVSLQHDVAGNRTQLQDSDIGTINNLYDGLGRVRETEYFAGANSHRTVIAYDDLSRITSRTDYSSQGTQTASWNYDPAGALGALHSESSEGYQAEYNYDSLLRPYKRTILVDQDNQTSVYGYGYDEYSRKTLTQYPSGVATERMYDSYGYTKGITDPASSTPYWQVLERNAFGRAVRQQFASGVTTQSEFDDRSGRLESITTGTTQSPDSIQALSYSYDSAENLIERWSTRDGQENLAENFSYDRLHRLKTATTSELIGGERQLVYDYDDLGNIKTKTEDSQTLSYSYGQNNGGVHAVSSVTGSQGTTSYHYDFKGNMTKRGDQTIDYSVFNKPTLITAANFSSEILYGPNRARFYKETTVNGETTQTYYLPQYEKVVRGNAVREKHYIGDNILLTRASSTQSNAYTQNTQYLHKDNLGSVEAITDNSGQLVDRLAFDPWGARRGTDWDSQHIELQDYELATTTKGFTGHEHLDASGLIHMHGRVYDPLIGRFLSTDNFVQYPQWSQGYNRYSYVHNRPLAATDPEGEALFLIPVAIALLKAADVGLTAYDTHSTLTDDSLSKTEKATTLGTEAALAVTPIPGLKTGRKIWKMVGDPKLPTVTKTISSVPDSPKTTTTSGPSVSAPESGKEVPIGADKSVEYEGVVTVSKSKHPESAQHILDAQAGGHPEIVTIQRSSAATNRRESLKGVKTEKGKDRDEYPPAMFDEGGKGASVRLIDSSDNRGAGSCIGHQCKVYPDGTKVKIEVTK